MEKLQTLTENLQQFQAHEWFYDRIRDLKKNLPEGYRAKLLKLLPQYDTYAGGRIIHNVLTLRTTDMHVLWALEKVVKKKNPA